MNDYNSISVMIDQLTEIKDEQKHGVCKMLLKRYLQLETVRIKAQKLKNEPGNDWLWEDLFDSSEEVEEKEKKLIELKKKFISIIRKSNDIQ